MKRLKNTVPMLILLTSIVLSSCGGGGGGSASSGSNPSPPAATTPSAPTISRSLSSSVTGQTITFSASTSDSSGSTLTYAWDFGDGTKSSGASVTKSYLKAGNFTVQVVVTNTAGLSSSASVTQAVAWRQLTKAWTRRLGGGSTTYISAIAKSPDAGGNTGVAYVVGSVCCGAFEGQSPTSRGDAFVTRVNPDGTTAWTRLIGGVDPVGFSGGSTTDAFGVLATADSVYVVGRTDAATFYGQPTNGQRDVFVARFAHDGTRIWTKLFGGVADDEGRSITNGKPIGSRETINIVGMTSSASFQGQPSNGSKDAFVLQLDTNGGLVWSRLTGGTGDDIAHDAVITSDGFVYVAGQTTSNSLDGQQLNGISQDAFVAKFNSDGSKSWTRLVGGTSQEAAFSIDAEADGNAVYITGFTTSTTIEGATANIGTAGDVFLTKIASDGTKTWTRTVGDSGADQGRSVSVASDGSIYVVGDSSSSVFDSNATLSTDIFITKFIADGTRAFSLVSGGTSTDQAFGLAVLGDGSILLGGSSSSLSVDGMQRVGAGSNDALMIKYALSN